MKRKKNLSVSSSSCMRTSGCTRVKKYCFIIVVNDDDHHQCSGVMFLALPAQASLRCAIASYPDVLRRALWLTLPLAVYRAVVCLNIPRYAPWCLKLPLTAQHLLRLPCIALHCPALPRTPSSIRHSIALPSSSTTLS